MNRRNFLQIAFSALIVPLVPTALLKAESKLTVSKQDKVARRVMTPNEFSTRLHSYFAVTHGQIVYADHDIFGVGQQWLVVLWLPQILDQSGQPSASTDEEFLALSEEVLVPCRILEIFYQDCRKPIVWSFPLVPISKIEVGNERFCLKPVQGSLQSIDHA